jgi:hypothetical protein
MDAPTIAICALATALMIKIICSTSKQSDIHVHIYREYAEVEDDDDEETDPSEAWKYGKQPE